MMERFGLLQKPPERLTSKTLFPLNNVTITNMERTGLNNVYASYKSTQAIYACDKGHGWLFGRPNCMKDQTLTVLLLLTWWDVETLDGINAKIQTTLVKKNPKQ